MNLVILVVKNTYDILQQLLIFFCYELSYTSFYIWFRFIRLELQFNLV